MRTLVDIPAGDVEWLDRKAAEAGKSRAAIVREAVARLRADDAQTRIARYFGLWKNRSDIRDGLEYQQRVRSEWSREDKSDR